MMAIEANHKDHHGLRVVHPTWSAGWPLYGTIVRVVNRYHVDISTTALGVVRAHQGSLIWQQDFKKK